MSRLRLRVKPGAARSRVVGPYGDRVKVEIAAPPEDGKANEALLAFLAKELGLPRSRITLERGVASRDKEVSIPGMEEADVLRRLLPPRILRA